MLEHPLLQAAMTPRHEALLARSQAFFTDENLRQWRGESGYFRKELWTEMARQGFIGVAAEQEAGGQGMGLLGDILIKKALSQLSDYGLSMAFHVQSDVAVNWLLACPNEYLRQHYLPRIASGELLSCTCYTEQDKAFRSRLEDRGDHYLLNARKAFVVNGYVADVCIVTADLDGEQMTVLVEKTQPGVSVPRLFERFGSGAVEQVAVHFEDVHVDRRHVVSDNAARSLLLWNQVMTFARFSIAIDTYFLHEKVLASLMDYGRDRRVNHKPLLSWPVNERVVAAALARHQAMTVGLVNLYAAMQGRRLPVSQAATMKRYCVQAANELCRHACEMEGGMGMMMSGRFLNYLAQAMAFRMASGSQTMLGDIVSRQFQQHHNVGLGTLSVTQR